MSKLNNTKLVQLLSTFSKPEVARFRDFVRSPFVNKNAKVVNLAEEIIYYYPEFDSEKFTERSLFKRIFPDEEFQYFKIKNILSDIYQLSVQFLTYIAAEKNQTEIEIFLLNELHERKLAKQYEQIRKRVQGKLSANDVRDEEQRYLMFKCAKADTAQYKFKGSSYTFDLIQKEFDAFINYTLVGLLKYYSKMLTNMNHGNVEFKMEMFDLVWDYMSQRELKGDPQAEVYKQIIELEKEKSEDAYRKLRQVKAKYSKNLSREDTYFILLACNSFVASRLRDGFQNYEDDRFEIFKELVAGGFVPSDYILFMNFISFYCAACVVGEFNWAEEFRDKYKDGISPDSERLNTLHYCDGFLAYCRKDYEKALNCFSKTKFRLYLAKVMSKSYTLRCLYELRHYDQLLSAIENFRKYLRNDKMLSDGQKEAHFQFMTHLSSLVSILQELQNRKEAVRLLSELSKNTKAVNGNPLGCKNWLITKLNDELSILRRT